MNTQSQHTESKAWDFYGDPEIEALVSALEAKWAAEKKIREAEAQA